MRTQLFRALAAAAILVVGIASTATAQPPSSYAFDPHTFTIQLPEGFSLVDEASPLAGYKTFGWVTAPRPDGTSGVIQVSLYDIAKMANSSPVTLDQFAAQMVASMQRAHPGFKSGQTTGTVTGVDAKLVEWTGTTHPPVGVPLNMHGFMITGIKQGVGFRVEAQEVESLAAQNLPVYLTAMNTFDLKVGAAPPAPPK
jgi:hypothetical protein